MSESKHDASFYIRSRRLIQMRIPLFLFLGVNFLLVCAVPFSQIYGKMVRGVTMNSVGGKIKSPEKSGGDQPTINELVNKSDPAEPTPVATSNTTEDQVFEPIDADIGPNSDSDVIDVTPQELERILGSNPFVADGGVEPADPAIVDTTPEDAAPKPLDPMIAMAIQHSIRSGVSQFTQVCVRQLDNMRAVSDSVLAEPTSAEPRVEDLHVVLHNPRHWDVEIHYVVDGDVRTLNPGDSHDLGSSELTKVIEFHRGGEFADAAYELAAGSFDFRVSAEGWELVRTIDTENVVEEQIPQP